MPLSTSTKVLGAVIFGLALVSLIIFFPGVL
jgi:hypothetical protein